MSHQNLFQKWTRPPFAILILLVSYLIVLSSFTIRRGFVDKCDGYNYLTNGYSLVENHREFTFVNINTYDDFVKSPLNYKPKQRPYPAKLFSVIAYSISKKDGSIYPANAAWLNIGITAVGFIFFYFVCLNIAGPILAFISGSILLSNPTMLSYLGRPLTDPAAWTLVMISFYFLTKRTTKSLLVASIFAGLVTCFRLQCLFLLPIALAYIPALKGPNSSPKRTLTSVTLTILVYSITYFAVSTFIEFKYLSFPIISNANSQFYLSWYQEVYSKFNLIKYLKTFWQICSQILTNPSIGFFFILSFLSGKTSRSNFDLKMIRNSAVFAFLLPILNYSSTRGFETRYLIYSIPIFILCSSINLRDLIVERILKLDGSLVFNKTAPSLLSIYLLFLTIMAIVVFDLSRFNSFINIHIPVKIAHSANDLNATIMSNKSIATLSTGSYTLVKLPKFEDFINNDNSAVSEILIYNDNNCAWDHPSDASEWQNKNEFTDKSGNTFILDMAESFYETLVYKNVSN